MPRPIEVNELPKTISAIEAIQSCYRDELTRVAQALCARQSVLVEGDKLLVPHLLEVLRDLLQAELGSVPPLDYVDHRAAGPGQGLVAATIRDFQQKVSDGKEWLVVPNFDLIVTGDQTGQHVDLNAREVMAIQYQNPDLRLLAFKDPNLSLPRTVLTYFPCRVEIFGVKRHLLRHLITAAEARRLDTRALDPFRLFKYVSGLNAAKLRQVLQRLTGPGFEDGNPHLMTRYLRQATVDAASAEAGAELPQVSFSRIGGYEEVKRLLRENILEVIASVEDQTAALSEQEILLRERLIPRNILFTGPPGTGKTLFCKAMATVLEATVIVVNGPELKSKWVGESEERIRKIFTRARKCAPSLIVFDEIDSFGGARSGRPSHGQSEGRGSGTASDHSMLNQLLTEMDGFNPQESVFVVATTNFASSLDDALRSRFRYEIEIPYPDRADREAIIKIYDGEYALGLDEDVVTALLDVTERWIDQNSWTRFAGRELENLCAALARERLSRARRREVAPEAVPIDVELAVAAAEARIRGGHRAISFADIGGYDEVKQRLQEELLDVLELDRQATSDDERGELQRMIPKGVIFEGPPGTGKTMFAKALAQALKATTSIVHGPELKSMWHGESERKVREVFAEARRNAPCVLVFDEIDSIAGERQATVGGVDRSTVNQLLTEMDGCRAEELVFVVATTNFAASLDQALKRPGRFEYVIHIGYPDAEARAAILKLYDGRYRLKLDDEAIQHLVFRTDGWVDPSNGVRYSGDHLEAICRGICRRKLKEGEDWTPTRDDLDSVVAQRTKKPVVLSESEEKVIAAHEAGHAIISLKLDGCAPIKKVSIASEYDGSLGYVLHGDPAHKYVQDEDQLKAQIVCLMGGREGERFHLGRVASGGADDIEKATLIATHLVAAFGMDDEIGPRMVLHPLIHGDKAAGATSPELLAKVERQVQVMLHASAKKARELIKAHKVEYRGLVERLERDKTIEF